MSTPHKNRSRGWNISIDRRNLFRECSTKAGKMKVTYPEENEYPRRHETVPRYVLFYSGEVFPVSCPVQTNGCPKGSCIEERITRFGVTKWKRKRKKGEGKKRQDTAGMRSEEEKDEEKRSWMPRVHENPSCV